MGLQYPTSPVPHQ